MNYADILKELIEWKEEKIITEEQFELLQNRYKEEGEVVPRFYTKFSKKKLTVFFLAFVIIIGSMAWLSNLIPILNDFVVFSSLLVLVFGILYCGDYIEDRNLNVIKFVGKSIMIIGCILFTSLLFYFDFRLTKNYNINIFGKDWAAFMIISSIILGGIGYVFREKEIIGYSILLSLLWFISEGKVWTGEYLGVWFGVTFATRLILFSLIFIALGHLHRNYQKLSKNYKIFANTYYSFGLLFMFMATFQASIGNWLKGSMISLKIQSLIFIFAAFAIAIYSIYYGIVKNISLFIKLGLIFFSIIAFGNLYNIFSSNLSNPLFYILLIIVGILVAVVVEYTLTHKNEIKAELLKNKN